MAKKKLTPNQAAFKAEQQRLKRAISREYKQTGMKLDPTLIPAMPKVVTKKSLEDIKRITPQKLRKRTVYLNPETGEEKTYKEIHDKSFGMNPPEYVLLSSIDYSAIIINNFYSSIEHYNAKFVARLTHIIEGLRKKYNDRAVSEMLENAASNGTVVTPRVAYSEEDFINYVNELLNYLPDIGPLEKESIMEDAEESTYWTDYDNA